MLGALPQAVMDLPHAQATAQVPAFNQAPLLGQILPQFTVAEDQLFTLQITGLDPDGDPVTFALQNPNPAGASLQVLSGAGTATQTAEYRWTPPVGTRGNRSCRVTLTDGLITTRVTFKIRVLAPDRAVSVAIRTPSGTSTGRALVIDVATPTASMAPFALLVGHAIPVAMPLAGIHGTGQLGLDPGSMFVLLNGFEPTPFNPVLTPLQLSVPIPAGLSGSSVSFQAVARLGPDLFTSPVRTIAFP